MREKTALACLSALSQETRLGIFRLLVPLGAEGLSAGRIAEKLGVQPATLTFHLHQMENAGLLTKRRYSRQMIYAVDYAAMRDFLAFLTEDCCQGHPEICQPAALFTGDCD